MTELKAALKDFARNSQTPNFFALPAVNNNFSVAIYDFLRGIFILDKIFPPFPHKKPKRAGPSLSVGLSVWLPAR